MLNKRNSYWGVAVYYSYALSILGFFVLATITVIPKHSPQYDYGQMVGGIAMLVWLIFGVTGTIICWKKL